MRYFLNNLPRIVLGVALGCLMPSHVWALTFTPDRINTEVYPGVPVSQELTLLNESGESSSIVLRPVSLDLKEASSGRATFLLDSASFASASWVRVSPDQLVLKPGEQRAVRVTLHAPATSAGSLMAGIAATFRPVRSDENGRIATEAVTGPLIFARVLSDASLVKGRLQQFEVAGTSSWFSSLPIPFTVTFANDGNVHLTPAGTIEIRNIFGRLVERLPVNATQRIVLPGTTRVFSVRWGRSLEETSRSTWTQEFLEPALGPYTATVLMSEGSDDLLTMSTTVWIFPWRSAILLGVLLLGLAAARLRLLRIHV